MNVHVRRVTRASESRISVERAAKYHLSNLESSRVAQRLVVFTPTAADIDQLLPHARDAMGGGGATTEVVHRVFRHNPDSFWAIARRENFTAGLTRAEGYLAFLMLTRAGMDRLFDGSFNATDPDLSLLCRQNEVPAGIYIWGTYARGMIAGGIPLAFEKTCTPRYREASLYARAVTLEGARILESLGFTLGAIFEGKEASNLYMLPRGDAAQQISPIYDSYAPKGRPDTISVTVARSIEDMMRVISVRSAVYIGEQTCPYPEEFDGNDFAGIHLLGYAGSEPVGCLRIRCFAGFAKLERLAVRREFRKLHLGTTLMQAGVELCRAKGYKQIYGRAEKNLLDYYIALGWKPLKGGRRVIFSDHEYVEILFEAAPTTNAITLETDPYVLMRPEGRWHVPGILEKSASRPVIQRIAGHQHERPRA